MIASKDQTELEGYRDWLSDTLRSNYHLATRDQDIPELGRRLIATTGQAPTGNASMSEVATAVFYLADTLQQQHLRAGEASIDVESVES